jgi:hypothetical protein
MSRARFVHIALPPARSGPLISRRKRRAHIIGTAGPGGVRKYRTMGSGIAARPTQVTFCGRVVSHTWSAGGHPLDLDAALAPGQVTVPGLCKNCVRALP